PRFKVFTSSHCRFLFGRESTDAFRRPVINELPKLAVVCAEASLEIFPFTPYVARKINCVTGNSFKKSSLAAFHATPTDHSGVPFWFAAAPKRFASSLRKLPVKV